jgi:anhydro-N-acetylmuramic acid kinase
MSGTSCDGVDAALIRTDGGSRIEHIAGFTRPYAPAFRIRLLNAAQYDLALIDTLRLEKELTELHAAAARELLKVSAVESSSVAVIGLHGHTLRHVPSEGLSLQIGDGSRLAELTGVPVVSDFRRRDLATGGQGAPLAPLFHHAMLASQAKPVAVLNIGGVSNVTWIGAADEIYASDAGPGCGLLDQWIARKTGAQFDEDGAVANSGCVNLSVVERALQMPFFLAPMPKSVDRFDFQAILQLVEESNLSLCDAAATLCAITSESVVRLCRQFPDVPNCLWLCGGGAKHPFVTHLLRAGFPKVRNISDIGRSPDLLEAECFAWLAVRRLHGLSTSISTTTGCRHATCGGLLAARTQFLDEVQATKEDE